MKILMNEELQDQSFILEEVIFINCKLKNCHLIYSGGEFEWVNTSFEGCGFHFRGAAKNTQGLFHSLGMLKEGPQMSPPMMSKSVQ
jgi:hypothetical protein